LWTADQEEREFAVRAFKSGKKDVLVATDVASKGTARGRSRADVVQRG